jgi:hypothetical protein
MARTDRPCRSSCCGGDQIGRLAPPARGTTVFVRREDGERFIEEVRSDDPELAKHLRIEERELQTGGRN